MPLQVAQLAGAHTMHLTVNSSAQDNPHAFFTAKCGFVERGHWRTAIGTTEYLLSLDIQQPQDVPRPSANGGASSAAYALSPSTAVGSDKQAARPAEESGRRKRTRADNDYDQQRPAQRMRPATAPDHHRVTLKAPYIRSEPLENCEKHLL